MSDQPIPNLTTALQFKPNLIVLLKTKEMEDKARLLEDVLKNKKFDVQSEIIEAYEINNVIRVSESLINKYKNSRISLNITGGTKIGTLGTFQAFYTQNKPIFYVNTNDNKIIELSPEDIEYDINVSISIKDYLAVYGFIINSSVKDDSYIFRRKQLTSHFVHNPEIIGELNYKLHAFDEKTPLPVTADISIDSKLESLLGLLDGDTMIRKGKLHITNYEDLRYLKGIWLEEHIYMIAKGSGADEVRLNVVGKWVTDSKHQPKNELDVLISKGTRLFYISCKTANPNRKLSAQDGEGIGREYLYELDSISDKAFGLFGKKMLASARKIEDPYVKERAHIMDIKVVDGKDIITIKEQIKQWLNK